MIVEIDQNSLIECIEKIMVKNDSHKRDNRQYLYLLYKNDICIYVGKTTNILKRIINHSGSKDFDYYKYLEIDEKDIDIYEKAFIQKYQPEFNKRDKSLTYTYADILKHEACFLTLTVLKNRINKALSLDEDDYPFSKENYNRILDYLENPENYY